MPIDDRDGCRVQAERAPRVAEALPHADRLARGVGGEVGRRGPALHPAVPGGQDPDDGGLLEHDLADQDAPRGAVGAPPGQVARVPVVPVQDGGVQDVGAQLRR